MAAPVPPPSQSPSKTIMGEITTGMKKNIHPFCHQKKQEHLADISRFRFKMVPNLGGLKKTKLPPTSPISSFILAWCGPQFSNSLAMTVFSSSSNVSRFSAVALAELDHFPFRFHSIQKNLENIKKNIPFIHLINPNQPPQCLEIDVNLFLGGEGALRNGPKKKPSLDISPGMGDSPFQIVVTSHGLGFVVLSFSSIQQTFSQRNVYILFSIIDSLQLILGKKNNM